MMRIRLILSFVIVILVTLSSVAYFVRQETEEQVNAFIYRGGIYGAEGLVEALEDYYQEEQSWEDVDTFFQSPGRGGVKGSGGGRGRGGGGNELKLYDSQGVLIYDPHNPGMEGKLEEQEYPATIPLVVDGDTRGYLLAPSSQRVSLSLENDLMERLNKASINAALIAGGLSLLLAVILTVYLMRPVRALTDAAGKMAEGDLSQRVAVSGKDEIAGLGNAFNQMAVSLEGEQERRQVMTADIAHELRTPLAIQRANLEAMLDGVEPNTDQNIQVTLDQNKLLERLVTDLRTLALADAGELNLELRKTDINNLVSGIVERFQQRAKQKHVRLAAVLEESVPVVDSDPDRIEQILVNLVDNALQYSNEGNDVVLKTLYKDHSVLIVVKDSGPGISGDSLTQVFDRFYRGDNSRSRKYGGTGLGLAIARKLAEAHDGSLSAADSTDGGAMFTLRLPVQDY
jgi:signal transduction histidine kinase